MVGLIVTIGQLTVTPGGDIMCVYDQQHCKHNFWPQPSFNYLSILNFIGFAIKSPPWLPVCEELHGLCYLNVIQKCVVNDTKT